MTGKQARAVLAAAKDLYARLYDANAAVLEDQHTESYAVPDDESTKELVLDREGLDDETAIEIAGNIAAAWKSLEAALGKAS